MRIAVITSSYPRYQGDPTAPFIKSLSDALRGRGHNIKVLAPYDNSIQYNSKESTNTTRFKYIWPRKFHILGHARSLEDDAKLRPLAVILLPLFLMSAFIHLLRITREQESDIIHAHWLIPSGLVAAWVGRIRKIPFVVSIHGSDIFVAEKNKLFRHFAKYVLRSASGVSACSEELAQRAKTLGAIAQVTLITGGADPEKFKPIRNKVKLIKQFGWPKNKIIICSVGRMVSKKGFEGLLSAFAKVAQSNSNIHLVIGGDGPTKNKLRDQAEQLGVREMISLPGRVNWEQLADFLKAADIFVLPSIRDLHGNVDGLPVILLEAMACGLPCIVSNIGGVKLVIRDDENGLIVQPNSINELTKAISKLMVNKPKRKSLGTAARRTILEKNNWQQVAIEFENLLSAALRE